MLELRPNNNNIIIICFLGCLVLISLTMQFVLVHAGSDINHTFTFLFSYKLRYNMRLIEGC